jgi:hypothetical protein
VSSEGDAPDPAAVAAAGPRALGRECEVREAVAAVHEGWGAHYGAAQDEGAEDADLALLVGDRCYADGLDRLAALGDLPAIAEMADVISLCAVAHAADQPDLAYAAWRAGAVAVGWGTTPELVGAKARARAGESGAAAALLAAVRHVTPEVAPER